MSSENLGALISQMPEQLNFVGMLTSFTKKQDDYAKKLSIYNTLEDHRVFKRFG